MKNIILIGMKGCGKTTAGKLVAKKLGMEFIELDDLVTSLHRTSKGERLSCREIYAIHGETYFRALEAECLQEVAQRSAQKPFVLSCGGGTPLYRVNRELLKGLGLVVFLDTDGRTIFSRIQKSGTPAFITNTDEPEKSLAELLAARLPVYEALADIRLTLRGDTRQQVVRRIAEGVSV